MGLMHSDLNRGKARERFAHKRKACINCFTYEQISYPVRNLQMTPLCLTLFASERHATARFISPSVNTIRVRESSRERWL